MQELLKGLMKWIVLALSCLMISLPGYAQWEGDDSYDPFADYSEFEETEEEEADINFFRNGRLFTIGLAVGMNNFTGTMGDIYDGGTGFGLFLTYFFDLRFAMQIGFLTADSDISIPATGSTNAATGNLDTTGVSFSVKYFLNTQNVTRGLANLNPYIIGGITQFHRTQSITDQSLAVSKDSAVGVDLGAGLEIPMLRGKMFIGLEGTYSLVQFSDEGTPITLNDDTSASTGITPDGDIYTLKFILGKNF